MGKAIFPYVLLLIISLTREIDGKEKRQISNEKIPYRKQAFKFGYNIKDERHGTQYRQEEGDHRGVVHGAYGYHDPYGIYRQVEYIADSLGFRAKIRSNEPGLSDQHPAHVEVIKTGLPHVPLHHNLGAISNTHIVAIHPSSSNENPVKVKDIIKPAETSQVLNPPVHRFESVRHSGEIGKLAKKQNDKKSRVSVLFSNKPPKIKKRKKKIQKSQYESSGQRLLQIQSSKTIPESIKQEVILEYPHNIPENPQNIFDYHQNSSDFLQNPLEFPENSPEVVEVNRPVPIPYLIHPPNNEKRVIVIHHPSESQSKFPNENFQLPFDPKSPNQQDTIVMVEHLPEIQSQSSVNHPHKLEIKGIEGSEYASKSEIPLVIIKTHQRVPTSELAFSTQQSNKVPIVIMKEITVQEQKDESTNNNIRPVASFVFEKDLKTSQTQQKIQCPIACFTPTSINGDKGNVS